MVVSHSSVSTAHSCNFALPLVVILPASRPDFAPHNPRNPLNPFKSVIHA